jgi:hypothetical protein
MLACGKYACDHEVCFAFAFAAVSAISRTFCFSSGRSLRRNWLDRLVAPLSAPASISGAILLKSWVVAVNVICARYVWVLGGRLAPSVHGSSLGSN